MNHQSHGLPRRILCQPCPKHFPPINSHTSHAVGEALLPSPLTDEEAQREKRKSFIQGHAAGNLGSEPRAHYLSITSCPSDAESSRERGETWSPDLFTHCRSEETGTY